MTGDRDKQRHLRYIARQKVRAKAYSRIFYTNARRWGRLYLFIQFSSVIVNVLAALLALMIEDTVRSTRMASGMAIAAGAIVTISTIMNPSRHETTSESAGDRYRIRAERLEMADENMSASELRTLVSETTLDMEALAVDTTEPDPARLDNEIRAIERRVERARQRFAHMSESEGETVGRSAIEEVIEERDRDLRAISEMV